MAGLSMYGTAACAAYLSCCVTADGCKLDLFIRKLWTLLYCLKNQTHLVWWVKREGNVILDISITCIERVGVNLAQCQKVPSIIKYNAIALVHYAEKFLETFLPSHHCFMNLSWLSGGWSFAPSQSCISVELMLFYHNRNLQQVCRTVGQCSWTHMMC